MTSDNAAKFFFGLYVNGASNLDTDTTWNEIDVDFGTAAGTPVYFSNAYFTPKEINNRYNATTTPMFNDQIAQGWHNYSLIWTPTSLTYLIDGQPYWQQINGGSITVPWRCSSYRFILRTDNGLSTPGTDHFVYLRRFKYQTLQTYQN
jgi:Glycosyl hydrolases family 16